MVELLKSKKENSPTENKEEKKEPIITTDQDQIKDAKVETKEPIINDQAKIETSVKKSKLKKVEDDHLIKSKGDPSYRSLLKSTNIDGVIEVLENKKTKLEGEATQDKSKIEKIEKAETKLKKLNKSVEEIKKIYSKENNEAERQEYIKKLVEKQKDPFEQLKNVRDRRVVNMVTRLLLKDQNINAFFVDYFGEQASFDREEWLLETSQNTGSTELKESINALLEQIRETREKQKTEEKPYFDLVSFLLWLEKAERGLKKPKDNGLEQIFENIDVDQLKYEIEKYIIDNPDNTGEYEEIVAFYNEYLNADLDPAALKNIDIAKLIAELESFVDDYTSVDDHDTKDIETISDLLDELRSVKIPESPKQDENPEDTLPDNLSPLQPTTSSGDNTTMPSQTQKVDKSDKSSFRDFWSTMGVLASWKGLDFLFSLATGLLFAPVTAAIWASKQRVELKKSGKNFDTKVDFSGLEETWHPFDIVKNSAGDKKSEDKKDKNK